jgi:hypothetical protein
MKGKRKEAFEVHRSIGRMIQLVKKGRIFGLFLASRYPGPKTDQICISIITDFKNNLYFTPIPES